ncbi:MAG TPA: thioredoxin family protein [Saprospiraceae bacterium]|nr:thioredoxin family protein [Saprospiraceae bacterium]
MKVTSIFRHIFFIVLTILTLQACNPKSSDSSSTSNISPQAWLTNLNEAYAHSVKVQKPVLVYFTSRDTCGQCKQLEADIISTPMFKEWAEKKVVLFEIDASTQSQLPAGSQEQNTAMARSLKVSTYPTFWMLSVTHEVQNGRFKVKPIGFTGYQSSPEKLVGALQNFVRR